MGEHPEDLAGINLPRLEAFFLDRGISVDGPLAASLLHGGRSNLTYELTDGKDRWVLRRPPFGLVAPSANDVEREFRVVDALQGTTIPVPTTIAFCADEAVIGAPFALVEKVEGRVLRQPSDGSAVGADAPRVAEALVGTLAAIHDLDVQSVGLANLGRPDGYVARQVRRWRDQWQLVATREFPDVDRVHARLEATVPDADAPSLVHGDFRLDNLIVGDSDPAEVRAVLDWEMATVGDGRADLGLFLAYQDPACTALVGQAPPMSTNDHFPPGDELVLIYEHCRGRQVESLGFFRALGYFKLAVIAEGIHRRFCDGDTLGDGFDNVGDAVAPLIEAALASFDRTLD